MKIVCPHCKRYLFETEKTLIAENVKCTGCKKRLNIKFVTVDSSEADIRHKFVEK